MRIPPPGPPPGSSSSFNPIGPTDSQVVDQFKTLWDNWYKHPSIETAEALQSFLNAHGGQIEQIGENNTTMMSTRSHTVPIGGALESLNTYLQGWINEEKSHPPANIQGLSEMIKDVYDWISYAR